MPFRLNLAEVSNWYISAIGDSGGASVGLPALSRNSGAGLSVGAYAGWFEVTSRLHAADVYRCYYRALSGEVGAGVSALGVITVSGATKDDWSVPGSPILRTGPFSPNSSGEGGDPTGFLGVTLMLTPSGSVGVGYWATLLMMGPPQGWKQELASMALPTPARFKYAAALAGKQWSTANSVSFAVQPGIIHEIWNQTTGKQVTRSGPSTVKR